MGSIPRYGNIIWMPEGCYPCEAKVKVVTVPESCDQRHIGKMQHSLILETEAEYMPLVYECNIRGL